MAELIARVTRLLGPLAQRDHQLCVQAGAGGRDLAKGGQIAVAAAMVPSEAKISGRPSRRSQGKRSSPGRLAASEPT